MYHLSRLFAFTLLLLTALSCSNKTENVKDVQPIEIDEDTVATNSLPEYPIDAKFNQTAKYLAGYAGEENSPFKSLESRGSFKNYQANIDQLWTKTNQKLPVIKDWTKVELSDINEGGGTLFYPFSGADFLHADLFFPEHDNIVMIALEPIGTLPDLLDKGKDTTLDVYLSRLKKSMNAILGLSFFRTIAMADDFKSELDGTLHVLMHFMARTDHEVMYQERVGILPNGELTTELTSVPDSMYIGNRYYFRKNGDEKVKTLTYFAVNVQNSPYVSRGGLVAKGLNTRTDLVNYFKKIDIKSTYLKSASYLMHRPTFSIIRNIILKESEHVLQDDSGIPVQFFNPEEWDLTFYGNYIKPISLFAERHQEDLKEIYELKKYIVKELPFGIGYQYHKGTSNMMRASKKN